MKAMLLLYYFFTFTDWSPLKPENAKKSLKILFKRVNVDNKLYNMYSLRKGRATDLTRMHSSGMRTTCLLTVSQHAPWPGGVPAQGSVPAQGCTCLGVPARGTCPGDVLPRGPRGCTCPGGYLLGGVPAWGVPAQVPPLWTDRHLWKHNLRKLCLRAVIKLGFSMT